MMTVDPNEYYTIHELVNEHTIGVMYWYVSKEMPERLLRLARGRDRDDEDLIQEAVIRLIRSRASRQFAVSSILCNQLRQTASKWATRNASRHRRGRHSELHDGIASAALHPANDDSYRLFDAPNIEDDIATLNEREQHLIRKRFGFDGPQVMGMDLADELGVCKARIYQLEAQALRRLKKHIESREAQNA